MNRSDYLIIGAGIIGLTLAREIKRRDPASKVTILEKENTLALHASGRNSGVLHSGIYYPADTLKAKVCAKGGSMMIDFIKERNLPIKKAGKVILTNREEELATLDRLMENAAASGINAKKLDADSIREIEPFCRTHEAGIYLPDVCVIDPKITTKAIADDAVEAGVEILYSQRVTQVSGKEIVSSKGRSQFGKLINCAGAYADIIASLCGAGGSYRLIPFKGLYYKLKANRRELIRGLIYPAPDLNFPFLGVHFTCANDGEVYVGPTAIPALGRENYAGLSGMSVGESAQLGLRLAGMYIAGGSKFRQLVQREAGRYLKGNFIKAAKTMVPTIADDDMIVCDKVGIRPQLVDTKNNQLVMDFMATKSNGTYHILNAISPAFTGSMAFAQLVATSIMDDDGKSVGDLTC
ncbi:MAG: L-2-hydroxyglutarate oxidase [Nitrospinota bacterium]|nr:L-2-hydroxyglutarate oxidase [Nitrospinota bacterium]